MRKFILNEKIYFSRVEAKTGFGKIYIYDENLNLIFIENFSKAHDKARIKFENFLKNNGTFKVNDLEIKSFYKTIQITKNNNGSIYDEDYRYKINLNKEEIKNLIISLNEIVKEME